MAGISPNPAYLVQSPYIGPKNKVLWAIDPDYVVLLAHVIHCYFLRQLVQSSRNEPVAYVALLRLRSRHQGIPISGLSATWAPENFAANIHLNNAYFSVLLTRRSRERNQC